MIVQVTPDQAERMWGAIRHHFERVCKTTNGCFEPADVLRDIMNGEQKLWVAWDQESNTIDAVMTTVITKYPRRTSCRVPYICGDNMKRWIKDFVAAVEDYARSEGATLLEGYFRRGWLRVWDGLRENGASLVKELT